MADSFTIIGLAGRMKSGKTMVADWLVEEHGFTKVSFGEGVRQEVARGWGVGVDTWKEMEKDNKNELRPILQAWGMARRKVSGDNYWVLRALEGLSLDVENIVVDDVRFLNEVEAIKEFGGQTGWLEVNEATQIERGANEEYLNHESEMELSDAVWYPSFVVNTSSTTESSVLDFVELYLRLGGFLG